MDADSLAAGPPPLGRGVIVLAGAAPPAPWDGAPRVEITESVAKDPSGVVPVLHECWAERTPVVVSLHVDPASFRAPVSIREELWRLPPELELWHDRLHFLVWNNNVDARTGESVWWWSRKAERVGATPHPDADIALPDGTPAWIDGGPPDDVDPQLLAPAALVRAEAVEADRLRPVPAWVAPTAELADDQLAAVATRGGPARIIAPAGSGKTRVLTERLRHLLADRDHDPAALLAVAYNRKAQEEMAARTTGLGARIQTLNALGYELVGRYEGRRPRMLDEREVRDRLQPLLPRMQRKLNTDPMAPYLDGLSAIRLGLRTPEDVEVAVDAPGLADAVRPFRAGLAADGVLDFDEQIVRAIELLLADGAFRRAEQARHRHLLVDEFQDLTPAHVLLVRILACPTFDVFGVGDDDQVIYGHAGADPRFLVDFAELFPGADEHALETNYRCAPGVIDAVRLVLGNNRRRVPKVIHAARPSDRPDALRVRTEAPVDGATAVVETVQGLVEESGDPDDVAVLARTNSLLLAPHAALRSAGVPVRSVLRRDVLDRVGLRAALAWLRVASDPGKVRSADLAEIRRRPSRGFPNWIDKWLARCSSSHEVARAAERIDDARVAEKLRDLAADIDRLAAAARSATTREVLTFIRDDIGLGGAMELLDGKPGSEGSSHLDDLDALLQVADLQPDPDLFEFWLRDALSRDPDPEDGTEPVGVTLSTIHRVKGREWPHVVLFGANNGVLPHRLADDVEEERRVFHVGVTRGIETVTILADAERPSPFLVELDGSPPIAEAQARRAKAPTNALQTAAAKVAADESLDGEDRVLFDQLREWRSATAKANGGPAYLVFYDATLATIARTRPSSLRELAAIKGVGPSKLENFGDDVLEIVARFA